MAVLNRFKSNWKIKLHTDWMEKYLKGKAYPICLEIDPSNKCPLNCGYCCWGKYKEENPEMLSKDKLNELLMQAKALAVKAIIWTGGGEPLSNPATVGAITQAKQLGFDNGLFTNAVLMNEKVSRSLIRSLNWIRFHLAGSCASYYAEVHHVSEEVFHRVYKNIRYFSKINKGKVNAGIGVAINPDNFNGVKRLPYLCCELGLEYFQAKLDFVEIGKESYVKWWNETIIPYFAEVEKELEGKLKIHTFGDPIVRKTEVDYCHAHHIITAITADGRVTFCKMRRDQKGTSIGNVYKSSLADIFDSQGHKEIASNIHPKTCSILASFCPYRTTNEVVDEMVQLDKSIGKEHRNFF